MTIQQAFELALQHHQAGRLAEAEALYRQILAAQSNHHEALHHLGVIAQQVGRYDLAVQLIRQALAIDPNDSGAYANLGLAYRSTGRLEEAIASYRRAIQLNPELPEAHNNLGIALSEKSQLDEAIAAYRRALQLKPDYADARNNLGVALIGKGQFNEAKAAYQQALFLKPDDPEIHHNLGVLLTKQGQLDEAIGAYRRALQLKPDYAAAHNNLGTVLTRRGRLDEAIAALRRALEITPHFAEAHINLGNALKDQGRAGEAAAEYRQALQLQPSYPEAHNNLGNVLSDAGRADEAIAAYRRALAVRPDYPGAHTNLGNALKDLGQLDEALATYRHVLQVQPDCSEAHSNLLYTHHFHPDQDLRAITAEHERWNRQFAEPLRKLHRPHANDRDPERRLRIGYVSPNFKLHPICHFVTPLLEAHDKARFEICCYASVKRPDKYTERAQRAVDVWCDEFGLGDHDLAERIRENQIDILVDLTQHMADNRLLTFARKPAPIQVAWLGYPASTGLPAMDYRFTDRFMEPEGSAWSVSVETPIRLPDCWFCFDPIDYPETSAQPVLRAGHITFGSCNNFCKINEPLLHIWVAVLQAVAGSRLLLHCPAEATQNRVRQWFESHGIAAHRLELVPRTTNRIDYLQLYHRIDIGLDPFPYNGGTTTCEALWMGVPVVSLVGRTAVSRLGLSILANLGLPELAASSKDDYVRITTQLASDLPRLAGLRATLRPRMQASPLMDAPRFARSVETAYRTMWRRWCMEAEPPQ